MKNNEVNVTKKVIATCFIASAIYLVPYNVLSNKTYESTDVSTVEACSEPKFCPTAMPVTNVSTGTTAYKVGNKIVETPPPGTFGITIQGNEVVQSSTSQEEKEVNGEVTKKLYPSIPLTARFQAYIDKLCKEKGISTNVVMGVICRESDFNTECIGDYGNSFGLMQVYRTCHLDRIKRLIGSTDKDDLLYCWNNVKVGIDILGDYYKSQGNYTDALRCYNGGQNYKNIPITKKYASYVMDKAEKYKKERQE